MTPIHSQSAVLKSCMSKWFTLGSLSLNHLIITWFEVNAADIVSALEIVDLWTVSGYATLTNKEFQNVVESMLIFWMIITNRWIKVVEKNNKL